MIRHHKIKRRTLITIGWKVVDHSVPIADSKAREAVATIGKWLNGDIGRNRVRGTFDEIRGIWLDTIHAYQKGSMTLVDLNKKIHYLHLVKALNFDNPDDIHRMIIDIYERNLLSEETLRQIINTNLKG